MSTASPAMEHGASLSRTSDTSGAALFYQPPADEAGEDRLWINAGGVHRVQTAGKARLLEALLELKPPQGARLVVLGTDVGALRAAQRNALRARIAFLPADGGMLSSLNAWENIVLPLAFHKPGKLRGVAERVYTLLAGLGAEPGELLPKLPEAMTLYEKKLAGYVRILLEAPELVLVEDLTGGLNAAEYDGTAGFFAAFHALCPQGTFVQLETGPDE